jgi:hypothetical protein
MVDKPMLEKPLELSSVRLDFLYENRHQRASPDQFVCEQHDVISRVIETLEHEQTGFPNPIAKTINKHSHKHAKKSQAMLGFHNKRVGHLISRSLCNRSKSHVSSIESIEIHENYDYEIEKFLAEEDPDYAQPDFNQDLDYVNNLPP